MTTLAGYSLIVCDNTVTVLLRGDRANSCVGCRGLAALGRRIVTVPVVNPPPNPLPLGGGFVPSPFGGGLGRGLSSYEGFTLLRHPFLGRPLRINSITTPPYGVNHVIRAGLA